MSIELVHRLHQERKNTQLRILVFLICIEQHKIKLETNVKRIVLSMIKFQIPIVSFQKKRVIYNIHQAMYNDIDTYLADRYAHSSLDAFEVKILRQSLGYPFIGFAEAEDTNLLRPSIIVGVDANVTLSDKGQLYLNQHDMKDGDIVRLEIMKQRLGIYINGNMIYKNIPLPKRKLRPFVQLLCGTGIVSRPIRCL